MLQSKLEIAGNYRRSGCKASQIELLAELNACSKETIIEILKEQGFEFKEKKMPRTEGYQPKGTKKATEPPRTGSAVESVPQLPKGASAAGAQKEMERAQEVVTPEKQFKVSESVKKAVTAQMIECEEIIEEKSKMMRELHEFLQQCY